MKGKGGPPGSPGVERAALVEINIQDAGSDDQHGQAHGNFHREAREAVGSWVWVVVAVRLGFLALHKLLPSGHKAPVDGLVLCHEVARKGGKPRGLPGDDGGAWF